MNKDEAAIRQVIATWIEATGAGDVERVLALMSPEAVFLIAGQPPMHGSAAFAASLRGLLRTHRIDSSSQVEEIDIAGDMAYCRSHLSVTVTPVDGGVPVQRTGNTLSIFRRGGKGQWLLTRDANMLAPAKVRE